MLDPKLVPYEKQDLLARVAAQAAALDMACYLVGGSVRDLLIEKPVKDIDIVVEGDTVGLGEALVKELGGKFVSHRKFLTATWSYKETDSLDLTQARSELYKSPGALPTVTPAPIEKDLLRRDFTINAMAVRLDAGQPGDLLDPMHGEDDLAAGLIRVLHPRSFLDDPTRAIRAIRYQQRFGFRIEAATLKTINQEVLTVLSKMSGERIRHELDLIFAEEKSAAMMQALNEFGLLKELEPAPPELNQRYVGLLDASPDEGLALPGDRVMLGYLLWLIDSKPAQVTSLSKRLDFTSELTKTSIAAIELKNDLPELKLKKPSAWTFRLERVPLMAIYATWLVAGEAALREFLAKWRHVRPQTRGDDLKALGIPAGPRYKEILAHLRAAWLDGEVTSPDDENSLLKELVDSDKAP